MLEQNAVCREIGARTGGDILIGVVGPVRTGKSTFIKRFMEQLVLPAMGPEAARLRARDELPQSAAGRTIMTTEPKFIPEAAVPLALEGGGECRVRLIDCVGYMVEGAMGHEEDDKPRMVKSPWFEEEIPFDLAAETGTRKVITDHSTIGIVVTTDGSISEIPRESYLPAEQRVVQELEALGKPFVILLNSTHPDAPETRALAAELEQNYGRSVLAVSCLDLDAAALNTILQKVLYEFPVRELDFALPRWVTMLDKGHWLQAEVYSAAMAFSEQVTRMKDLSASGGAALACDAVQQTALSGMNLSDGIVRVTVILKPEVFYQVLSEQTGLEIGDEAGLMPCILSLAKASRELRRDVETRRKELKIIQDTCGEDAEACKLGYLRVLDLNAALAEHLRLQDNREKLRRAEAERQAAERARAAAPAIIPPTEEERQLKVEAEQSAQNNAFITASGRLDCEVLQRFAAPAQPEPPARKQYRFWVEFTREDIAWFKQGAAERGFLYGSIK